MVCFGGAAVTIPCSAVKSLPKMVCSSSIGAPTRSPGGVKSVVPPALRNVTEMFFSTMLIPPSW